MTTENGADMVKIFPCSAMGGAKYLKALRGPFPKTKFPRAYRDVRQSDAVFHVTSRPHR